MAPTRSTGSRLGRPATGKAKSSTQRSRERRERLALQGADTITAVVSPAGLARLAELRAAGLTVDQAITWALEHAPEPPAP